MDRLPVLKALGDNTRYAIYLELARATSPLATAEVADALSLHPNTVRPHLERMRDVGLLAVVVDNRGSVGRPQHRYALAADAPSLGLEPPTYPVMAGMLANVAAACRPAPEVVSEAGRDHGRHLGAERQRHRPVGSSGECVDAVMAEMADAGFDPVVDADDVAATIAFASCPFLELAEAFPELVCQLHRGMIEGMVEAFGGVEVVGFAGIADRDPCQVALVSR